MEIMNEAAVPHPSRMRLLCLILFMNLNGNDRHHDDDKASCLIAVSN